MKNLFLLVAVIFLTVFTGSAQISYAEQQGTRVIIKQSSGTTKSISLINDMAFLGYGSSVVCISNRSNIDIYNSEGKYTGRIQLINGDKFLSCSGSEVITVNPRGRKVAYGPDGKGGRCIN